MTFIDITCMSERSVEVIIETFPRRNNTPFFTTRSYRRYIQISLHDRVVKKGVSFLRGNVSIITSSDLSDMHMISILPPRRREG